MKVKRTLPATLVINSCIVMAFRLDTTISRRFLGYSMMDEKFLSVKAVPQGSSRYVLFPVRRSA